MITGYFPAGFWRLLALALLAAGLPCQVFGQQGSASWVGSWGVAPVAQSLSVSGSNPLTFNQQTLRQIVHTSIAGSAARIRISNVFGTTPLTIQDVHIASSANNNSSSIVAGSDQTVTFQGSSEVTIAAGGEAISDAINFAVPALADVAVSMYFPGTTPVSNTTTHVFTEETNFYASGDVGGAISLPGAAATGQYYFLTGLDVQGPSLVGSVVTLGASITDGFNSTALQNHRWPNDLAQRLQAAGMAIGVLNEGIAGNEMLADNGIYGVTPAHRFGRDVANQAGVHWVIMSDDPINDLGNNAQATASELIAALQQVMNLAHQGQLKFLCSTLTPYMGASYWTASGETNREQINAFIRSPSNGCDGVVDQDAAVHDPNNPESYLPAYDSGDHLHPNDAGYQAIANAVSLALFSGSTFETPYGGIPTAIPGTVQAENYDTGGQGTGYSVNSTNGTADNYRSDGVDLEATADVGGGYDIGWTSSGQWFRYTVNVATAGVYAMSFRVAAPNAVTDAFHVSDSSGSNSSGAVNVPATGGWQTWATVTASITLSAGTQVLTLNEDTGGWNINNVTFAGPHSQYTSGTNISGGTACRE
jgi:lysophospholipase L1-like esterase